MAEDAFQARLKRIAEKSDPPGGGDGTGSPGASARRPSGGGGFFGPGRVIGLFMFGVIALVVVTLSTQVTDQYAVLSGSKPATVNGASVQSWFKSDVMLPEQALPPAPDNWVRVTQQDALTGDVVQQVMQAWPPGEPSVRGHLGFPRLLQFHRLYSKDDLKTRARANRKTTSLYLSTSGAYLNVSMIYRSTSNLLGPASDPSAWATTLAEEARNRLETGKVLETAELAGFTAINRTRPSGSDLMERPLSESADAPTALHLRAALTNRALLEIQGIATAQDVAAILQGVNLAQLP